MNETYGILNEDLYSDHVAMTEFAFSVRPIDLITYWQRCGLTADFFAQFETMGYKDSFEQSNILSTVVNELLENAVKFSGDKMRFVSVDVKGFKDKVIIVVSNDADKSDAENFLSFVNDLMADDFDEEDFFIQQLEKEDVVDINDSSRLGLLTLTKDFGVDLGMQFLKNNDDKKLVSVKVAVRILKGDTKHDH